MERSSPPGDITKIIDSVRASAVFPNLESYTKCVKALVVGGASVPEILRVKDRVTKPNDSGHIGGARGVRSHHGRGVRE